MTSVSASLPAAASWLPRPKTSSAPAGVRGVEPKRLDLPSLADAELVQLACGNHQDAYREIVVRYERPLFSMIFRMVRDRGLAEDLTQEAFVRAFKAIDSFKPSYKFSSWIFKIAHNHTIDHLRRRRLQTVSMHGSPHARTADEAERSSFDAVCTGERPDQFVENRELGGQIEAAIATLRDEYRAAIILRHVEGYSYNEIAEIIGVPLGTVKTYIHRARNELKAQLAPVVG
ncbi:MAG: sigma-70 family RNA polymerase sigma factor [Gemmatimonadetes bacterium]|nr:sigma-70 family RNA polymerase sigma factor [Gemmatimonadota bacterium]